MGYMAEVIRCGTCACRIKVEGSANVEKVVYLLENPEAKEGRELIKTKEECFEVETGSIDFRPYFAVKTPTKAFVAAERTLPVEGMNNFRDLGGYETDDGHYVKWGKLYRSDHIYNATPEGITYLRKLKLHTVVDYRSADERMKYPNGFISDDVKTVCLDPDAHTAELAAQFTSSKDNEDENLVKKIISQKAKGALVNRYDMVMEQYGNFVKGEKAKEAFGALIKIASNPASAAIVQHCRGGKDRTGFGSMLLLGLLGVRKELLVEDYMFTHENRKERNRVKMAAYRKYTDDPVVLDYLYSLIDTKPEFIEASYEAIINGYHSIEEYAIKELGTTKDDIIMLKKLYLD